jgi:pantoate--beta-alanine ligase
VYKRQLYNREELVSKIDSWKKYKLKVGFVPTMGALHKGHTSLVEMSGQQCDRTIVSIFVNPTQFNNPDDFQKYPSTLDHDFELLLENGCDAVFVPTTEVIYPNGPDAHPVQLDLGYLGACMEGLKRPGHFDGVVQVVYLLLNMVKPDILYLGAKDIQQVKVITKMVDTLNLPTKIVVGSTVRENDGLAMSSRNMRLNADQRKVAPVLYRVLSEISNQNVNTQPAVLTKSYIEQLNQIPEIRVDYLEIVDFQTLMPLTMWNKKGENLACIAAWVGDIRLIDNVLF